MKDKPRFEFSNLALVTWLLKIRCLGHRGRCFKRGLNAYPFTILIIISFDVI
jgi:hypothetical protein